MKKLRKYWLTIQRSIITKMMYVNTGWYMKHYIRYLKKVGVRIEGKPNFISNDVYLDGKDYSLITLGNNVTISREVMFLTHDYSMHTVSKELNFRNKEKAIHQSSEGAMLLMKGISVGDNSFIGARTSLLPGTTIGKNVLIGACSVVKGHIPDNSIVIGNPAKPVDFTDEWLDRKLEKNDFVVG